MTTTRHIRIIRTARRLLVLFATAPRDPVADRYRLLQWDRARPHTCSRRLFGPSGC